MIVKSLQDRDLVVGVAVDPFQTEPFENKLYLR